MEESKEPIADLALKIEPAVEATLAVKGTKIDPLQLVLPGAILLAAAMISGSLLFVNMDKQGGPVAGDDVPLEKVEATADDDPVLGARNAKVTIIEFSDYQCPFCRRFWKDTLPELKQKYIDTGKVRLVYRDFPLSFHPAAQISAEAGECADDQGKYWEMHDKMFSEQEKLGTGTVQYGVPELKKWAREIGLNGSTFDTCLDTHKHQAEVAKDAADGAAAGVTGTPAFVINGTLLVGAQPFAEFQKVIDAELK